MKTLILAVAFDLARNAEGLIVVGPETKICLQQTVREAALWPNPIIVVAAGCAPGEWNGFWMAQAMKDYLAIIAPNVFVIPALADTFNTSGEAKAFAGVVEGYTTGPYAKTPIPKCIVVVKWWHAWRTKLLCEYWFKRTGLGHVPIEIVACESKVNWTYPAREWLLAVPKNLLKMAFRRL